MAALRAARLYVAAGAVFWAAAAQNIRRRLVATPAVGMRSRQLAHWNIVLTAGPSWTLQDEQERSTCGEGGDESRRQLPLPPPKAAEGRRAHDRTPQQQLHARRAAAES